MQVTLEYMILIPLLILQIFIFPLAVSGVMDYWVDSRRTLFLEETVVNIGSAVQQVCYSLNHTSIREGTIVNTLGVRPFIEGYVYTGNVSLNHSGVMSNKILYITLTINGTRTNPVTTSVLLGENVELFNSTFTSNIGPKLIAQKYLDEGVFKIRLSFGEEV